MELQEFFSQNQRVALAFSGGTDSAYLLYAARKAGTQVAAYFIKTFFQPNFELKDAQRLSAELGVELTVLEVDVLADENVAANPNNRCYYCKTTLFRRLCKRAAADGYPLVIDGTNASDDAEDRPGMWALRELGIRSPLRELGITKAEVRRRSREAGLFTWDKPAYACLATRIPTGEQITCEKLQRVEEAEKALFSLGFSNFRVRLLGEHARLQLPVEQMERVIREHTRIQDELAPWFDSVLLDLQAR